MFSNVSLWGGDPVVCEIMWKNIVESGGPQMTIWRLRIACWITRGTITFRLCNTYGFSTATIVAQRASLLYYTYMACFV